MKKIFLVGTNDRGSIGVEAMVVSTIKLLREKEEDSRFYIISKYPDIDLERYSRYDLDLDIVEGGRNRGQLFFNMVRQIKKSNIVIFLGGDGLTDAVGPALSMGHNLIILISHFFGKPAAIFPSSIGPYNSRITRSFAKFCFNRTSFVAAREEITEKYLKDMGVLDRKIILTADIAFVLNPANRERINEIFRKIEVDCNGPLVGININQLIIEKSLKTNTKSDYVQLMAEISQYVVNEFGATVLLIPHEIYSKKLRVEGGLTVDRLKDDVNAVTEVTREIKNKNKIIPIENEYDATELKGIIGCCDIFIGARMHSNIAAISSCVPTLAISYSHKTPGIMRMVGLEEYVCKYDTTDVNELKEMINKLWTNRHELRHKLSLKIPVVKDSIEENTSVLSSSEEF